MTDLIKRDDALAAIQEYAVQEVGAFRTPDLKGAADIIRALPAIDPAAMREAALQVRIEELMKERDFILANQTYSYLGKNLKRWLARDLEDAKDAAEAKLTKAVEALEDLVRDCEADYPPSHGAIKHFAIATLAEIKGESHE